MKDADSHRDGSSLQLLGKEFIIVMVVAFSALSFTLGYFVGKNGIDRKPENLSQASEITPIPQKQEPETLPRPQNISVTENMLMTGETAKEHVQPQQNEAPVGVEAKQTLPVKSPRPAREATQAETGSQRIPEENNQEPAAHESKKSAEPVYTVQIGAFKNSSEAEAFRKNHASKELKTYITTSTNKKKEKIFKVKAGEFSDRKSAEVLALRLSKTGKLKTYVTLKNE